MEIILTGRARSYIYAIQERVGLAMSAL